MDHRLPSGLHMSLPTSHETGCQPKLCGTLNPVFDQSEVPESENLNRIEPMQIHEPEGT